MPALATDITLILHSRASWPMLFGAAAAAGVAYHLYVMRKWRDAQPDSSPDSPLPLTLGGKASSPDTPTVVFIHGMGCSALEWAPLSHLLRGSRWAALDRVLGVQGELRAPRTARTIIEESREMLRTKGIVPPYVLVGHSFGGLIARAWALEHPKEAAALLLLDPMHEDFVSPLMPFDFRAAFDWAVPVIFATLAVLAPLGLVRLLDAAGALGLPPSELFPAPQRKEAVALYSSSRPWLRAAAELHGSFLSLPWVHGEIGPGNGHAVGETSLTLTATHHTTYRPRCASFGPTDHCHSCAPAQSITNVFPFSAHGRIHRPGGESPRKCGSDASAQTPHRGKKRTLGSSRRTTARS
jgi:pimeloyl-ACP methyl ester carboxylesterase